ncbi:hypothetical protein BD769DRAFT_1385290 [Suillus cothurnatus]|nr:hypothetical protein BD769DRAFT_1385290 [Suillus cothurnatus]
MFEDMDDGNQSSLSSLSNLSKDSSDWLVSQVVAVVQNTPKQALHKSTKTLHPKIRLLGHSILKLKISDKAQAQEVMEQMRTWKRNGALGVFQDEKGRMLVAYFERQVETNAKPDMLDKVLVATQLLVHHIGVQHTVSNYHHDQEDFLMRYTKASILSSESVAGPTN